MSTEANGSTPNDRAASATEASGKRSVLEQRPAKKEPREAFEALPNHLRTVIKESCQGLLSDSSFDSLWLAIGCIAQHVEAEIRSAQEERDIMWQEQCERWHHRTTAAEELSVGRLRKIEHMRAELDAESIRAERAEEERGRLQDGIRRWIDEGMVHYTDAQYGKGEMRALLAHSLTQEGEK